MTAPSEIPGAVVKTAAQAIAEAFNEGAGGLATGEDAGSVAADWMQEARAALEAALPALHEQWVEAQTSKERYELRRRVRSEQPPVVKASSVGDLRRAMEGLPDDAQMFLNIDGYGEDYAIELVWPSQQIPVGVTEWPTDKRTVGLEIHVGRFDEPEVAR